MIVNNFTVPIITGPTKEELDQAITAIEKVKEVEKNFFVAATTRGERPEVIDEPTYDYCSLILEKANLKWKLQARFIPFTIRRIISSIHKRGDNYFVRLDFYINHNRTLVSPETSYKLHRGSKYTIRIVYNPITGRGHVYELSDCNTTPIY